jgi:putative addiction module component (TIGR02574 family)
MRRLEDDVEPLVDMSEKLRANLRYSRPMADVDAAEILQKAMSLPAQARLALADELLDSVEGPEDPEWAKAWAAEIGRRVQEVESGQVQTIPWEVALETIRARLRAK